MAVSLVYLRSNKTLHALANGVKVDRKTRVVVNARFPTKRVAINNVT